MVARDSLSQAFAALSDPSRRAMVARLCESDAALVELAEPLEMSMQAVSKHLRMLEDAGLVTETSSIWETQGWCVGAGRDPARHVNSARTPSVGLRGPTAS